MKKIKWIIVILLVLIILITLFIYYKFAYPYSGNAGQFTEKDLKCSSYFGQYNQKKIGTPNNWVHILEGTESAMWHAPENWSNPMLCDK